MYIQKQFSVFMVNKPGVMAQILGELAQEKINITALTVMDSVEHGVLRIVCGSAERMRDALTRLNMQFNETDVLCVTIDNRAGAFATITEKLAKAHINITYAYVTAGAKGGKTTAVLKVADVKKAIKVIGEPLGSDTDSRQAERRPLSTRKG